MNLVDSDIFIDFLNGYPPAIAWLSARFRETILFSAVTETELLAGQQNHDPKNRQSLIDFLANYTKIPLDNPLAEVAGDLRRAHGLKTPDAIIAASAMTHNATLVTRNIKDFKCVPKLKFHVPY